MVGASRGRSPGCVVRHLRGERAWAQARLEEPFMGKKRVLIVDDAVFMRNMIKDIFSSGEYEIVGEAANGIEAVERYRDLKPDLTTMDIVMPFKSGIEAT